MKVKIEKVIKNEPQSGDVQPVSNGSEESKCCSCDSARCKLWCIKSYHPTKVRLFRLSFKNST